MSFLGRDIRELVNYNWELPGIGKQAIGYGICEDSGLVLQTSSVDQATMIDYYKSTATYVNPHKSGEPSPNKVKDLDRLITMLNAASDQQFTSALQIGSSDGYTLSRFRTAGIDQVLGVEPGDNSRKHAKNQYGIDSIPGTAEDFQCNKKFDLIILTHILEHLYDPLSVLKKVIGLLENEGRILIEVPLWERLDRQPHGVLTFEHVNYFCENTLKYMLALSGLEITDISKHYYINLYPVIAVVAKITDKDFIADAMKSIFTASTKEINEKLLRNYLDREKIHWHNIDEKINKRADHSRSTYIYGAGIHTSQLLSYIGGKITQSLDGIIDSSPSKWGKKFSEFIIKSDTEIRSLKKNSNIIISSAASENAIIEHILSMRNDLNLITLYR